MNVRWRLTLSYAGFLLVAGLAMVALLLYVLRFVPVGNLSDESRFVPDRDDLVEAVLPKVWLVLLALAVVGLGGGWWLAGRMLRPLHRIHAVAARVSSGSLDERVRLAGPDDEIRQLARTFDSMLDRLQDALDEHGRFAANASHELRTPYAVERAMLDVALADPAGVDVPELVRRLDETNRRGTRTVESLLALAALEHGQAPPWTPIDLAELAGDAVAELASTADRAGIVVDAQLGEADLDGVEPWIGLLLGNLIRNGIQHNDGPGGHLWVRTSTLDDGRARLCVVNSGPPVPPDLLPALTEPFVRAGGRGSAHGGSGLGLAIVSRVARVHDARLHLDAPTSGGLAVQVTFVGPRGHSDDLALPRRAPDGASRGRR